MKIRTMAFLLLITVFFLINHWAFAVSCDGDLTSCNNDKIELKIACLEQKKKACSEISNTLSGEINRFNTQIYLTQLKIEETEKMVEQTEKEIETLGGRIEGLDSSLSYLTKLMLKKIVEGYKKRSISLFDFIFNTESAKDFIIGLKYLKTAQDNNQRLLIQVQQTKLNFEEQKKLREEKKVQLDNLKILLSKQNQELITQKAAKQKLLVETQNSEVIYQQLLDQARAEYAAIQGIIAGAGTETQLREVKKGETIAVLISGSSCNSSGTHLHFIVQEGGTVTNPFNYLKPVEYRNCSGASCDSPDGDLFNPSGIYDWPLNPPIELDQGYGNTWAIRNTWVGRIYSFHNGIDINGSSNNVLAVADGTLYKGVYNVGCPLSYVKLVHKDSNLTTLYLHVYPQ